MINEHVTDKEIQIFILEGGKCDVHTVEHIRHCSQCALKAAEYKVLFEGIEQQEKPLFDFPLADLVIVQLPAAQPQDGFDRVFLFVIALVGILFVSTVLYLFKDILLNPAWKIHPFAIGLIITTVASVLVFLVTDSYRKYQNQMDAINFY